MTRGRAVTAREVLVAEVERVREAVSNWHDDRPAKPAERIVSDVGPIAELGEQFGLSAFERDVIALTAAVELDGTVARLVADAQGGGESRPAFALALSLLADAHWDALAPGSPLRFWHLVEPGPGQTLATRPLQLDERVLHHLTGSARADQVDHRLSGVVTVSSQRAAMSPSQEATAAELAGTLEDLATRALVVLDGDDRDGRDAVTSRLAERLGGHRLLVSAAALPAPGPELALTARLIDREQVLHGGIPVVEPSPGGEVVTHDLIRLLAAPVVVHLGEVTPGSTDRLVVRRSIDWPTPVEQQQLWADAFNSHERSDELATATAEVAEHYRLGAASVQDIARELTASPAIAQSPGAALHRLCRQRCRVNLDGLADRITTTATWDDLVLPPGQMELLRDVARQVRHRHQVYEEWGFAGPTRRGLGVTALFSGESGTGKTLAAEVLAAELELDLYRIDLSATVSKYIGETEKNLQRLFDAAETSGSVLLFDEADALFGKRGEVKQAHDRYANLEVAYLLGRMESYRGLALLTTNLRGNLDRAFLRRLRFVLQFPFPDEAQRAEIWRRMFPPGAPTKGIEPTALARLTVPGGAIRSIAVSAAFAAADDGSPITPAHVLRAAEVEYAKADRSLTDSEKAALR